MRYAKFSPLTALDFFILMNYNRDINHVNYEVV